MNLFFDREVESMGVCALVLSHCAGYLTDRSTKDSANELIENLNKYLLCLDRTHENLTEIQSHDSRVIEFSKSMKKDMDHLSSIRLAVVTYQKRGFVRMDLPSETAKWTGSAIKTIEMGQRCYRQLCA